MIPKQFRWILPISVTLLAVMACGQVSLGVITPTVVSAPEETPPVHIQDTTGDSTTADPDSTPTPEVETAVPTDTDTPETDFPAMAYVGQDGNLWLLEMGSEAPRQLTSDANPIGNQNTAVEYSFPRLSYDGQFLAYRHDVGIPINSGYDFI